MKISVTKTSLEAIQPFRVLFLHQGNFQFIRNSYHARNWAEPYLFSIDEKPVGYGALSARDNRRSIFEFYVLPPFCKHAALFFNELLTISKADGIDCQSNDLLLTQQLYSFAKNIYTETILFEDFAVTELACNDVIFRKRLTEDKIFEHKAEPDGDWVIDRNGEVVATGGFLLHYNMPYADLYMEVAETHRRKGYGSFLIQQLKEACYLSGRVPAARCGLLNAASKNTLLKAGMKICGYVLTGDV